MTGKLPEIFWYLFWIGFVILAFRMAYLGGRSGHEKHMKALEILKLYAEQGAEPPPAMMDQLAAQVFQEANPKRDGTGGLMTTFLSLLFMACVSWGVSAWLSARQVAPWAPIAATAALAFFGIGAAGFLIAALFNRKK
jgi:hypothetical protein